MNNQEQFYPSKVTHYCLALIEDGIEPKGVTIGPICQIAEESAIRCSLELKPGNDEKIIKVYSLYFL